ncbi:MAG: oligosaccharide flippase family protein [Rhizobiales bacterium]|nr:oligosaccharide flippase family protein [Hyphomicrobiales bacterium]
MKLDDQEYYSLKRLRSSTMIFAIGKVLNAGLSFAILVLVASNLSRSDFAIYAWLVAFTEFTVNISRFGINHLVLRYAPELRARHHLRALARLLVLSTLSRVVIMVLFGLVYYECSHLLLSFLGKEDWLPAFDLYIAVIIPFGLMVFLRDTVFQSLLEQGLSQSNTTIRHVVLLGGLALLLLLAMDFTVIEVIYVEIIATMVATLAALIKGWRLLRALPHGQVEASGEVPGWLTMVTFAANNYASELLRMLGSNHALMTVAPQMLSVAALAPFGFCLTLFGQIYRFLPAQLFSGLYRPKLIAEYTKSRNFGALNRQIIMILKISNYVLACGLALFVVYGNEILDLMSGGKYGDEYVLMLAFFVLMFVENFRLVLSDLCATIEKADLLRNVSLANLLIIPIAVLFVALGLSYYGLVAAIVIGEGIFVSAIVVYLLRQGVALRLDAMGQLRIAAAAVVATALGFLFKASVPAGGIVWMVLGAAVIGLAFLAAARLLRPLSDGERDAIERLAGRKVYLV